MIKPLGYDENISLDEARQRLTDLQEAFDLTRSMYDDKGSLFGKRINKVDLEEMSEMVGVLFPLMHQPSACEELRASATSGTSDQSICSQAAELMQSISLFLCQFVNSGAKLVDFGPV